MPAQDTHSALFLCHIDKVGKICKLQEEIRRQHSYKLIMAFTGIHVLVLEIPTDSMKTASPQSQTL